MLKLQNLNKVAPVYSIDGTKQILFFFLQWVTCGKTNGNQEICLICRWSMKQITLIFYN